MTDFEDAIQLSFNASSFTFDPTLKPAQIRKVSGTGHVRFHEIGLTGAKDKEAEMEKMANKQKLYFSPNARLMYIDEIMKMLGHNFVDIFKLDCEGCEESFIPYLKKTSSRNDPLFGQMIIEFHK